MSMKEYISKARKSLNDWAENNLPSGKLWSTDILESYRIERKLDPAGSLFYPITTGMFGCGIAESFMNPTCENLLTTLGLGIVTVCGYLWMNKQKDMYDEIGESIKTNGIPVIGDEKFRFTKKMVELYVKDHGLEKQHEIAKCMNLILKSKPKFG